MFGSNLPEIPPWQRAPRLTPTALEPSVQGAAIVISDFDDNACRVVIDTITAPSGTVWSFAAAVTEKDAIKVLAKFPEPAAAAST